MTWTSPSHVSGGLASSAQFNEEVADNIQHLYDRIQTGTYTFSVNGTSSGATTSVSFSSAFGSVPRVVGAVTTNTGTGANLCVVACTQVTVNGFTLRIIKVNTGSNFTSDIAVNWIAVGSA